MSIPRMRTIPECVAMLKELDPDTAITLTALRNKVKRGEIPAVSVGSKRLINFDLLLEMFCLKQPAPAPSSGEYGKIRPISENLHRFG